MQFLQDTSCDQLFLEGDIIEGWQVRGRLYWPEGHEQVMKQLLAMAKAGTKDRYITGTHGDYFKNDGFLQFDTIDTIDEYCLPNKVAANWVDGVGPLIVARPFRSRRQRGSNN